MLLLFAAISVMPDGFAQLKVFPLPPLTDISPVKQKSRTSARTKALGPLALPFWDDFSFAIVDKIGDTRSNYPIDSLWESYKSIWVSNGIGLNPPSLNVVTFNGLNASHKPYSDQLLANGTRDTLTSRSIDLDDVIEAERNSVYLSFFYQWYGNGEPPDDVDYLQVEFKDSTGLWEPVMTILTRDSYDRNEFYDTLVKVDGGKFFHDDFQFRFRNKGRLSGPYDTWNIDYVYLNKGRDADDLYFPDQAIASPLTNLFGRYRAIPYPHFLDSNSYNPPTFDVFNVNNVLTDLSYITEATFTSYIDSVTTSTLGPVNLGDTSAINVANGIIFERERRTVTLRHMPDGSEFDPDADSASVSLKVKLFTGDTYDPKDSTSYADDYDPKYIPIDFRSNDTLRSDYVLANYYAYDDGFAENAIGVTQAGNRAAYLFDMLTKTPDTLTGFDIYFPEYAISSNLTAEFVVYDDNDGVPGDVLYSYPNYTIRRVGLNKFQRIKFDLPFLVEGKFYIGWKGPVGGTLKIGFDTNSDSGEKLYLNTNGSWIQNTDVQGNAMIRPVFGIGDIVLGLPEERLESNVYPNPNHGEFYIPSSYYLHQILSVTGQSIPFETLDQGENQKVLLPHVSSGLYILRLQKDGKFSSSKIIVK